MVTTAIRVLIGLIIAAAAALALLYVFQSRLIYPAPQVVHDPAPDFEAVTLAPSDGLELQAHWRAPEADQPTIVFFHGNGGSLAIATEETALLATQGYGVLLVEYRGYGGNPGEPSEEGLYRDGRAAMAFLREAGIAPERTIAMGHSLGSGTATQMAKEFNPAALILVAPFSSLVEVASERMPFVPVDWMLTDRYNNIVKLRELTLPVLIQHGTADTVVPYGHGVRLAKAGPTAELQTFEGAQHNISRQPDAQIAQSEWLAARGL